MTKREFKGFGQNPTINKLTVFEKANKFIADILIENDLPPELHFRVTDTAVAFTYEAIKAMRAANGYPGHLPGNDSLEGMGIERMGGVSHPLADITVIDGEECTNAWGFACIMLSTAMGWYGDGDKTAARKMAVECIKRANPLVSANALLEQTRYSDAALLKAIGLIKEGFDLHAKGQNK